MKVGFTGTREGMTSAQADAFAALILQLSPTEFHHGDCIGSDDQAANLVHVALADGCEIVCHPPSDGKLRAFNTRHGKNIRQPFSYLTRNRNIVGQTELLIACPKEACWQPRGGTWYTVDHAMKKGKPVRIIYPDGSVKEV